jgi:transglutaminase-like putative cysteine protease
MLDQLDSNCPKLGTTEFVNPQGAQMIRHKFRIKVWELRWDVDPAKVIAVKKWPEGFDRYLQSEERAVVVNDQVRQLAQLLVPRRQGPAQDLATALTGINGYMKYDHTLASLQASSEHALKHQRGRCSDYHGLCAAVGRALGYPTRVTYGINPFPKSSPSHCKLEAFLPPYGWVSFDVAETQRLIAAITSDFLLGSREKDELIKAANRRLIRGFRDNTWFLQTRGTDYDLAPPASKRVAVVRTIHAEADGVALPEPDPANPQQREFAWMTAHQYKADKPATYPFADWKSLREKRD